MICILQWLGVAYNSLVFLYSNCPYLCLTKITKNVDLKIFIYTVHKSCPNLKFHIAVNELPELN